MISASGNRAATAAAFAIDGVEYYGSVSYLKGGLATADAITAAARQVAETINAAAIVTFTTSGSRYSAQLK